MPSPRHDCTINMLRSQPGQTSIELLELCLHTRALLCFHLQQETIGGNCRGLKEDVPGGSMLLLPGMCCVENSRLPCREMLCQE